MKKSLSLALVAFTLILSACATNSITPQSPKVSLKGVKPLKLGLTGQKFTFTLKADNPNKFKLPISATDFTLKFNGQEVAQAVSKKSLFLPAEGSEDIAIDVDTNLMSSMSGIWKKLASGKLDFEYELAGGVTVDFGVAPFTVPYSLKGNLLDKIPFVGKK